MAKIEHLVVLALENRSFDHLVGSLRNEDNRIDGQIGTEFNYADPGTGTGKFLVTSDAPYVPDVDPGPGHDFSNALNQIFLSSAVPNPIVPDNCNMGFAFDYRQVCIAAGQSDDESMANARKVLRCFGAQKLPALHALAREFAICNKWFSSVPGPTWPNRFFMHCATSGGYLDNELRDYPMRTLFQNLSDAHITWRVYYHDAPQSLALRNQRQYASRYEFYDQAFVRDCRNSLLPQYSFIEPRYSNEGASRGNDQHPIHGVRLGDALIADVYEAVRASRDWETTMLLITWDEHGGFYDHVVPERTVNPDNAPVSDFDFTLLGLRVPAIVISPYIPKATVDIHTIYDHSSICASAKELFGLPTFLTRRDAQANTFLKLASLAEPRTDTPQSLPRLDAAAQAAPANGPATELHSSLTKMAESLTDPSAGERPAPATEQESGARIRAAMDAYRQQTGPPP